MPVSKPFADLDDAKLIQLTRLAGAAVLDLDKRPSTVARMEERSDNVAASLGVDLSARYAENSKPTPHVLFDHAMREVAERGPVTGRRFGVALAATTHADTEQATLLKSALDGHRQVRDHLDRGHSLDAFQPRQGETVESRLAARFARETVARRGVEAEALAAATSTADAVPDVIGGMTKSRRLDLAAQACLYNAGETWRPPAMETKAENAYFWAAQEAGIQVRANEASGHVIGGSNERRVEELSARLDRDFHKAAVASGAASLVEPTVKPVAAAWLPETKASSPMSALEARVSARNSLTAPAPQQAPSPTRAATAGGPAL